MLELLVAGTLLGNTGCGSTCDKEGLAGVASTLSDATAQARKRAFKTLSEVCPNLPVDIAQSLAASYADEAPDLRAQVYAARSESADYLAARKMACSASSDAWNSAVGAGDGGAAVYDVCDFERYGLLEPAERFAFRDVDAYVLYAWLVSNRNDADISRDLVRGLLTATADTDELVLECLRDGRSCSAAMRRAGVQLPNSSELASLRPANSVFISDSQIRLGPPYPGYVRGTWQPAAASAQASVDLTHGVPAAGTFVHHIGTQLLVQLTAAAANAKQLAEAEGRQWEARLAIYADGATPFGTIGDVMFTANQAGFETYSLAIMGGHGLGSMRLGRPLSWAKGARTPSRTDSDSPPQLRVSSSSIVATVSGKARTFEASADCFETPGDCLDRQALGAWFRSAKLKGSDSGVIPLAVEPAVPLQTLVTLLDTARGTECASAWKPAGGPESCLFWLPIVDQDPGLYWGMELNTHVTLGQAKVRRTQAKRRVGPTDEQALAMFEAGRERIASCLEQDSEFQRNFTRMESITLMWASLQQDPNVAEVRIWTGLSDDNPFNETELRLCLSGVFGYSMEASFPDTNFGQRLQLELLIPVNVSTSPKPP